MINELNTTKLSIRAILLFGLIALLSLIGFHFFLDSNLLNEKHFFFWDAKQYYMIKHRGYDAINVAFFPLFPFTWKLLSLSAIGISMVNGLLYLCSFYFLSKSLKLSWLESILYLTVPSSIFYFLPFTEALFFCSGTMILLGYRKSNSYLLCLGLLLSTLVRPVFMFFVLAMVVTELYNSKLNQKTILRILLFGLTLSLGLVIVFTIHYCYTSNWFAYFEIVNSWGNGIMKLPKLPFTSWSEGMIVRLDGAAMFIGICAFIVLSMLLLKLKLFKKHVASKEVVFSLTYLASITLFIVFRGGEIFSLNRFIFAVPFIIVAFDFWIRTPISFKWKHVIYLFGILSLYWLLFGSYGHIQTFLKFALVSLYLLFIFIIKLEHKQIQKFGMIAFILINFCFQLLFYYKYLNGDWIG